MCSMGNGVDILRHAEGNNVYAGVPLEVKNHMNIMCGGKWLVRFTEASLIVGDCHYLLGEGRPHHAEIVIPE